jgi:hypothetical protein
MFPAGWSAHYRAFAVVDLRLLAEPRRDDARGLRSESAAHAPRVALQVGIAAIEAVPVDQALPDHHRVSAAVATLVFAESVDTALVVAGFGGGHCAGRPSGSGPRRQRP